MRRQMRLRPAICVGRLASGIEGGKVALAGSDHSNADDWHARAVKDLSGVLGAYLLLYPHARVLVLIPFGYFSRMVYLPAMVVLGFWFLLQFLSILLADPNQPGVAFGAHAGGFVAGMLLIPLFKRREIRLLHPRQLH